MHVSFSALFVEWGSWTTFGAPMKTGGAVCVEHQREDLLLQCDRPRVSPPSAQSCYLFMVL
jgi:hypothetical protein